VSENASYRQSTCGVVRSFYFGVFYPALISVLDRADDRPWTSLL